jgi:hypothetical protein
MIKIQNIIEKLMKTKDLKETFKTLIYLIKKYIPLDFKNKMDLNTLLHIKTLNDFLKQSIIYKRKENIDMSCHEILRELNDLFVVHSPSNLKEGIPNLTDLDEVYKLLRLLTDEIIKEKQKEVKNFVEETRNKEKYCKMYMQYLENMIKY